VTAQTDTGRTTFTLLQGFKKQNHVEEMRHSKARSQVRLETCSLDPSKMLSKNKLMGCSNSPAEEATQKRCIYGKELVSAAQDQTMALQDQELGEIVDRLFLG